MENDDSKDYENVERGRDKDKSLSGVSDDFEVVYDASIQAGADVFFSTVGAAAFHAAIPPTVRIMGEGYNPRQQVSVCMCAHAHVSERVLCACVCQHVRVRMFVHVLVYISMCWCTCVYICL